MSCHVVTLCSPCVRPCPLVAPRTWNAVDGRLTRHTAPLRSIGNQTREDSLLAQKVEVGVTAGTSINDCGKVLREIVCRTVIQGKSKRELQLDLRCPDDFAVLPGLTVNTDFSTK